MVTSSKQIPLDFHDATPVSDWLVFHSNMAQIKIMPRKWEYGKTRKVKTQAVVHAVPVDPQHWQNLQYLMRRPLQPQVRWREGEWRQVGWRRWRGHQSHLLPDSWARWPQRPGHQCQVGRSWPERKSDWLWEARLPKRSSWRPEKWRSSRGTDWGQWLSARSTGFRRVLSS